ncbi:MAG: hypothetical protein C4532_18935 [Candidatus Abyssobacteria bacterium SURF_17]|uniref:Tetratricopeptide repeat protein n=1 Tax=Candidatus Abyssobacteria bacterium SURF_17 TaxID=2093361 RepID=A0A419EP97_9BACT|nr:MAG: hypothetical protein C4532_18935 [Candidatus Abyssubacteria bacterium SURF_17]
MVLTPEQKRRLSELDAQPAGETKKAELPPPGSAERLRTLWSRVRTSRLIPEILPKVVILGIIIIVAGHFIVAYQLYRIDFKSVLTSGRGTPVDRLWAAVKLQKEKARLLDEGHAHFLSGDLGAALATAASVARMDPRDARAQSLIDLVADAAVQRATKQFDAGSLESSLEHVRLALKYRPEHEEANELNLRIGERLLREAQAHYRKKEYAQLITKGKEVLKINPSDIAALNLLMRANNELLTRADERFIGKRYHDALEDVRLSLKIEPTNLRARELLNQISFFIETPDVKLRGITRFGKVKYATIQVAQGSPLYVKEGDLVRNFQVTTIDPEARTVKLVQVYTKEEITIELTKPE